VQGTRVVQVDRCSGTVRNAVSVRRKFGVEPGQIPDFLALVGDPQDGYPGIDGIGRVTAARLLNQYAEIERFPSSALGGGRERALLFKRLATLRTDAPVSQTVDELEWKGPTDDLPAWAERIAADRLVERSRRALR